jgi:chemotaxis protein MotB
MTTFSDMVTLLLTFFILLLSMADFDKGKFEKTMKQMTTEMGLGAKESDTSILQQAMQDITDTLDKDKSIELGQDENGLTMEFASSTFFKSGSSELQESVHTVLTAVAETLSEPRYANFIVEIEGHTDDVPIKSAHYPSNWELSTSRADSVVRFLISKGVPPKRMKATGYADTRPKVPNRTADGAAIPENQAQNRRVIARIYPMTPEERNRLNPKPPKAKAPAPAQPQQGAQAPAQASPPASGAPQAPGTPPAEQPAAPAMQFSIQPGTAPAQ